MRQISLPDPARSRQMHILTTRRDILPPRSATGWDHAGVRRTTTATPACISIWTPRHLPHQRRRPHPNGAQPGQKPAHRDVENARRALKTAESASTAQLLAARSPQPGSTVVLTNTMINTINTDVHTAEKALDAALAAHAQIPARLPLSQVNPGQQVLDTETKLIHHAIRIAAYNTAQSLARAIATDTGLPALTTRPTPDPHRPGRLRRHHPRPGHQHLARPVRPATNTTSDRGDRRTLPSPQRHPNHLPWHRAHPALQHQIPPQTAHH